MAFTADNSNPLNFCEGDYYVNNVKVKTIQMNIKLTSLTSIISVNKNLAKPQITYYLD